MRTYAPPELSEPAITRMRFSVIVDRKEYEGVAFHWSGRRSRTVRIIFSSQPHHPRIRVRELDVIDSHLVAAARHESCMPDAVAGYLHEVIHMCV